jgi:hypothetical protein
MHVDSLSTNTLVRHTPTSMLCNPVFLSVLRVTSPKPTRLCHVIRSVSFSNRHGLQSHVRSEHPTTKSSTQRRRTIKSSPDYTCSDPRRGTSNISPEPRDGCFAEAKMKHDGGRPKDKQGCAVCILMDRIWKKDERKQHKQTKPE